jgi:hypothetical protein
MRFFNTAGPCKPDIHYMLPASARLPELRTLIDQQAYIFIHAPRQVGKTTTSSLTTVLKNRKPNRAY